MSSPQRLAGVFLASVSLAFAQTIPLVNAGFETDGPVDGIPSTAGVWGADQNAIVSTTSGITPLAGARMLSFIHTSPGNAEEGTGADVVQLVNLSAYASSIAAGTFSLTLSASFNRVVDTIDTDFVVSIRAYSNAIGDFPTTLNSPIAAATATLSSDSVLATWESLSTTLLLPTNTSYVGVWVSANEATAPSPVGTLFSQPSEFEGHFADNVSLTAIPEPSSWSVLTGGGALGLGLWRRRRAA